MNEQTILTIMYTCIALGLYGLLIGYVANKIAGKDNRKSE